MRTIAFVAGVWFAVWTQSAWAACDSVLMARMDSANLTAEQKKIVCGDDKEKAVGAGAGAPLSDAIENADSPKKDGDVGKLNPNPIPHLESHFPTSVGMTKDNDDVWFLDANISLRYPLMYQEYAERGCNRFNALPYFAFTGRFGQYIETRDSSPVVLKAFNPELFVRFFFSPSESGIDSQKVDIKNICDMEGDLAYHNDRVRQVKRYEKMSENDRKMMNVNEQKKIEEVRKKMSTKKYLNYLDIYYGHLSNGQGIDEKNQSALPTLASTLGAKSPEKNLEFAKDYISRGWDYIGFAWTEMFESGSSVYVRSDKYIGGFLQQDIEENPWEAPMSSIRRLKQVDGIKVRYATDNGSKNFNYVAAFNTGTQTPFKYNTFRLEAIRQCDFLGVPTKFWMQHGYLSDLAQYYKLVHSYGIAFQFATSNNH